MIVSFVRELSEILQIAKSSQKIDGFPQPENKYWFALYTKGPEYYEKRLIPVFQSLGDFPALFANSYLQARGLANRLNLKIQPLSVELKNEDDISQFYNQNMQSDFNGGEPLSQEQNERVKSSLMCPEFLFLLKVVLPCLFLYSNHYAIVFRKARQGDVHSLEQLLRIDKTLIQHPRINKWVKYYAEQTDTRNNELLSNALAARPTGSISNKRIKYSIAGFLAYSYEQAKQPISYPEIQQLFDAVAADSDSNLLRDESLPEIENSFYTAVKREKQRWHQLLDKNRTKISKKVSE